MKRVGEAIAAANAEALREHLSLSGRERLAVSERLSRRGVGYAKLEMRAADEPWKLHERARQLGLYKP